MSDHLMQNASDIVRNPISPISLFFQRVWPPALIVLALVITLAWIALLGCEFVGLIGMAL